MPKGLFVTFEGGEGAGKTTQIKAIKDALEARGLTVVTTREPGGTAGAEAIRALLVSGETSRWDVTTELLLATAARRDHVVRVIAPALEQGAVVLCDRFVHSTLAYQGGRGAVTDEDVRNLHALAIGSLWPDITFIFDLDPDVAAQRSAARDGANQGRFEKMDPAFHSHLRDRFMALASQDDVCQLVDAAAPVGDVTETILTALSPLLDEVGNGG
ncbi:MAG: dTMP kinase [Pseudomonadota bacterium]